MTRARCCLGSPELRQRFEAVRCSVIHAPRDQAALAQEIQAMRGKLRAARPAKPGLFDVKHSTGGMVDVEFVVQYLVLAHACRYPQLVDNVGNIALLQRAQTCGLLPGHTGNDAAQAYRTLRQIQHKARLNEEPTQVDETQVSFERMAGLALWSAVFGISDA